MRLAAAESRLELDDWLAVEPAHAAQRLHEQALHPLGHVGAVEELDRVAVLELALATRHLRQIGGELRILVAPLGHVHVGLHYLAPAGQPAHSLSLLKFLPACRYLLSIGNRI